MCVCVCCLKWLSSLLARNMTVLPVLYLNCRDGDAVTPKQRMQHLYLSRLVCCTVLLLNTCYRHIIRKVPHFSAMCLQCSTSTGCGHRKVVRTELSARSVFVVVNTVCVCRCICICTCVCVLARLWILVGVLCVCVCADLLIWSFCAVSITLCTFICVLSVLGDVNRRLFFSLQVD